MPNEATFTPAQQAERLDIALRAACETEAVAKHLNTVIPMGQPEYMHLRAMVVRILSLNNVIWAALDGGEDHSAESLRSILEGC